MELEDSEDNSIYEQHPEQLQGAEDSEEVENVVFRDREEHDEVPELEAPPPPIVGKVTTSAPIVSTLKVKETVQLMETVRRGDLDSRRF